jgi:hypothetical protein
LRSISHLLSALSQNGWVIFSIRFELF